MVLPEFTVEGDLPPGVHISDWREAQSRFCGSSLRRVWLSGRLRALLELAGSTGKLHRIFIWGSFVTAKEAPKDLDILLIMDEDFEVAGIAATEQDVFKFRSGELRFGNQRLTPGMGYFSPDALYSWTAGDEGAEWIEIHSGIGGIFTDRPE